MEGPCRCDYCIKELQKALENVLPQSYRTSIMQRYPAVTLENYDAVLQLVLDSDF